MIEIRDMTVDELERLRELDVSEDGYVVLKWTGEEVVAEPDEWHRSRWSSEECSQRIDHLRDRLAKGDTAIGAFDGATLVGLAIFQPELSPGTSCFLGLWVSASHRRQGIATRLSRRVDDLARQHGAEWVYVSARPAEPAVRFYLSQGFAPTPEPNQEMYAIEPEDIHMIKELPRLPGDA